MNKRLKRTILLGVCLSPFVAGISTVNAINGLSAAPSLYYDMKERAGEWQDYAHAALAAPEAARTIADTLAPSKESICLTAGLEESEGIITGAAGEGALSAAFVSACASMKAIDVTLKDTAQRNDERTLNAAAIIERLLAIPEQSALGIFERQDAFRDAVAPLKDALAAADAENLQEKVRAQAAILTNSVATLETQDTAFGERQRAAVAALQAQLRSVEATLNAFLDESAPRAELTEPADLLSSGAAIARWWPRLLPQILAAIGVDLAILWMAGFLAVSRASLKDMKAAPRETP